MCLPIRCDRSLLSASGAMLAPTRFAENHVQETSQVCVLVRLVHRARAERATPREHERWQRAFDRAGSAPQSVAPPSPYGLPRSVPREEPPSTASGYSSVTTLSRGRLCRRRADRPRVGSALHERNVRRRERSLRRSGYPATLLAISRFGAGRTARARFAAHLETKALTSRSRTYWDWKGRTSEGADRVPTWSSR